MESVRYPVKNHVHLVKGLSEGVAFLESIRHALPDYLQKQAQQTLHNMEHGLELALAVKWEELHD